jgi:hypothetical protein
MIGPSHGSGRSGTLGRTLPAARPGDSNRRYMVAIVASRTQQMIWEIMSTVKTTDSMPMACTRNNPDATAQRRWAVALTPPAQCVRTSRATR